MRSASINDVVWVIAAQDRVENYTLTASEHSTQHIISVGLQCEKLIYLQQGAIVAIYKFVAAVLGSLPDLAIHPGYGLLLLLYFLFLFFTFFRCGLST